MLKGGNVQNKGDSTAIITATEKVPKREKHSNKCGNYLMSIIWL